MTIDADMLRALLDCSESLAEDSRRLPAVLSEMARQLERLLPEMNGYLVLPPLGDEVPVLEVFGGVQPPGKAARQALLEFIGSGIWEEGGTMPPDAAFGEGFASGTRFLGAVPIRARTVCLGYIVAASSNFSNIEGTASALTLLRVIGDLAGVHVANAQENEAMAVKLQYLEQHDTLVTQLPNRRLFRQRTGIALQAGAAALLFFDLDGFKQVNRGFGYAAGDVVLAEVADRWRAIMERDYSSAMLARMGGDEFAVLLGGPDMERAEALAKALIEALREPCGLAGVAPVPRASAGISHAPEDGTSVEDLLRCAETAMFFAKTEGGDCYALASRGSSSTKERRPDG